MKNKITLVFAVHNHQPVGNFDHVFRECFEKCYKPFISVLKRHPHMRISLHYTGPLLTWMEQNEPASFEKLSVLIAEGQVEMMGGGFYEPLLAMIPRQDAIGQIRLQADYLKKHFDCVPRGAWLAERVWDGSNPEILEEAGIIYTIIDDTHFKYAGFHQEDIHGYYVTEKLGAKVNVIPIDKNLRYMIPFADPQKVVDYLGLCAERFPASSVCYADDGEKFGVWPETFKTCYEERWLERFFEILKENEDWIEVKQAGEVISSHKSNGLVYLPDASYEEMLEWALPLNAAFRYKIMKKNLEDENLFGQFRDFIRGGIWPNFLVKYPESNLMYRKMLRVSDRVNRASVPEQVRETARSELYKGQCNCSYWHGLFGGLYLNYLRHAVYSHLINADNLVCRAEEKSGGGNRLQILEMDYTSNGFKEIVVENRELFALFSKEWGGSLVELDYRPADFNLSNVMTRRKEAYHLDLIKDRETAGFPSREELATDSSSVNDLRDKRHLENVIYYDRYNRYSFLDHFFEPGTGVEEFIESRFKEYGDFRSRSYLFEKTSDQSFVMTGEGSFGPSKAPVSIRKEFIFDPELALMNVNYELINHSDTEIETAFGIEFNYTLLAGRDEGRFYEINDVQPEGDLRFMISSGVVSEVKSVAMVDLWSRIRFRIDFDRKADLYRYPVETVSQSESGLEKTYQGSSLMPSFRLRLLPGEPWRLSVQLTISEPI